MLGALIRKFSIVAYDHPVIPQNRPGNGPFGRLKIALLADYFTSICLAQECNIQCLTPANYKKILREWRPDLIFVESAFHGVGDEWRYKLARQPLYLRMLPAREVAEITEIAADRNIPAVFWNKDDSAFFEAFIDIARLFPFVFTTDAECVPRYEAQVVGDSVVDVLQMPYQPAFHNFNGFSFEINEACFAGSYYRKILKTRRGFLDMVFNACENAQMRLHIFDRNSNRVSHFFEFRYPQTGSLVKHPRVSYPATATLYKSYVVSINVNSVVDSNTMYSRRLLEILACGGICVTNSNPAVDREFADFCHVVTSLDEATELLARLAFGPQAEDLDRAAAGAAYVAARHTWKCRLEKLAEVVNF